MSAAAPLRLVSSPSLPAAPPLANSRTCTAFVMLLSASELTGGSFNPRPSPGARRERPGAKLTKRR